MQRLTTLAVEFRDAIAVVELNRPDSANALNEAMSADLASVAAEIDADMSYDPYCSPAKAGSSVPVAM